MNINTCPSAFLVSWCYELKIFQLDLLQNSDNDRNQERVEVSRSVHSQRKAVFLSTNVGRFFIPKFNEALQNFLTKFNLGGIWERPKKIRKFLVLSLAAAVQYRLCLMTIVYLLVNFSKVIPISLFHFIMIAFTMVSFEIKHSVGEHNLASRFPRRKRQEKCEKSKMTPMEGLCGWILLKKSKLITRTREVIQSLSSDGICGSSIKTIWRTCQRLSGQQDVDLTAFKCHEIIAHLIIFDQLNIFFLHKSW